MEDDTLGGDSEELPEPGTRVELVAAARAVGLALSDRLFVEWGRLGLVGAPMRRRTGPHGQDLALYSGEQRALFRLIACDRVRGVRNAWLAVHPIHAWLNFGDTWVAMKQLRAALTSAVGDPRHSRRAAAEAAKMLVDWIDVNDADVHARKQFKDTIADQLYDGHLDAARTRAAVAGVVEPRGLAVIRGPVGNPLHVDGITFGLVASMTAARRIKTLTDDQLLQARLQHWSAWQQYALRQATDRATAAPDLQHIYTDVPPSETVKPSLTTLLQLVGMNLLSEQDTARTP